MLYLSLLGVALASMPVYFHNAKSDVPEDYVLAAADFSGVVAHFIGVNDFASQGALNAAQYVPSTFMDSRKSSAVVITDFDYGAASSLGHSVMSVANVERPQDADVSTPLAGEDALAAVQNVDTQDTQTLLVSASGIQQEILDALVASESKLLILGIERGAAVPNFRSAALASEEKQAEEKHAAEQKKKFKRDGFLSLEECEQNTNNCSGHGKCVPSGKTFACACRATKDHKYTYYWGGSACEKRDVSWQFNLLLWTSVGILLATVAGVSMLFSINSQPLPGVLNFQ